jgi:hypothetical protein
MEVVPVLTGVLIVGAVLLLIVALFSQTIHKFRTRTSSNHRFELEPPQYFRRYRATP